MAGALTCLSCKKKVANLKGVVKFPCPQCAKTQIVRCGHCRSIVAKYACAECGFTGPN